MSSKHKSKSLPGCKCTINNDGDGFEGINVETETPEKALEELSDLICGWVEKLNLKPNCNAAIETVLRKTVSMFPWYNSEGDGKVVEVWALFWAYKKGKPEHEWFLKVILDFDGPSKSKCPKHPKDILPHFGYEIYLNNVRQKPPGPGHVYVKRNKYALEQLEEDAIDDEWAFEVFDVEALTPRKWWYRNGKPMREIKKGIYAEQITIDENPPKVRLDCATRLWGIGLDRELYKESDTDFNMKEYNRAIHKDPYGWSRFAPPCFGRPLTEWDKLSETEKDERRYNFYMGLMKPTVNESAAAKDDGQAE